MNWEEMNREQLMAAVSGQEEKISELESSRKFWMSEYDRVKGELDACGTKLKASMEIIKGFTMLIG